ncbi:hypothetical protein EDB84DRAFT_1443383 [Lactarius hengduanensis]|nr:hypothetical protein EDB84DRAFT_1443383 [Lactarius hengduanensis]
MACQLVNLLTLANFWGLYQLVPAGASWGQLGPAGTITSYGIVTRWHVAYDGMTPDFARATFSFSTNSTALQTAYSEADANRVDSTDLNLMCDHFAFPREGTAYVNARAILENPRIIPGPQDSFIFDVIICCSLPITGTQVVCSLCYLTRQDNEYIDVGLYDIYAKNTIGCFFPTGHTSEKPDTF